MTIEKLREVYNANPFQPFVVHLADGRELPVPTREFLAISPGGRTFVLWQPDDTFHLIDLLLVTDLQIKPSRNGGRRRK